MAKKANNKLGVRVINPVKPKFKRLFWDIEVSYNIGKFWRSGYNLNIGPDDILKERAIICISYKWAGEKKVHSLKWNKGEDKDILSKFVSVLNQADESIGHNSDRFDLKWLRTRCLFHRVPMFPKYQTLDTLKLAKTYFNFNSNKLDYISKYIGSQGKLSTGIKLWDDIVLRNDPKAMIKMIKYCEKDVIELEKVFDIMNPYTESKVHAGVIMGNDNDSCPNCGGNHTKNQGFRYLASGNKKQCRLCLSCGKGFTVPGIIKL